MEWSRRRRRGGRSCEWVLMEFVALGGGDVVENKSVRRELGRP